MPAIGLLCPGAAWGARSAFQDRCEAALTEPVSVSTAQQNGYSIDNSVSYRTLTAMKAPGVPGMWVLGLTKTDAAVSVGLKGVILDDRASGYECVVPQIEVSLVYTPTVIYVGREFAPASCGYKEILAHEMRHLNTYLDHMPKVETVVRAALRRRFEATPLYAPAGQARSLLAAEIDRRWVPFIKNELGKVELLQAAIDSPQEYARLSKVCKGEVQSLIGSNDRTRR